MLTQAIVDIGANRGFTTMGIFAAWGQLVERQVTAIHARMRRGWHKAGCGMINSELFSLPRVVAFEPDPNNYAMLHDAAAVVMNYTATGKMAAIPSEKLTLVNAAVGKAAGTAHFASSQGGSGGSNGFSRAGGEVVRVVRLDEELPRLGLGGRLHFVKSDLEGYDPNAIYGAERLLRRHLIDLWYYEYHGKGQYMKEVSLQQMTAYLERLGYASYLVGEHDLVHLTRSSLAKIGSFKDWSNVLAVRKTLPFHARLVLMLNRWRLPCAITNASA